jgi:hypothetical protein
MWYTPGLNASRQYHEFTQAGRRNKRGRWVEEAPGAAATLALPFADTPEDASGQADTISLAPPLAPKEKGEETAELVAALVAAGLNRSTATAFSRERAEECRQQLAYLPYVTEFKTSKGAYLRRAIEQGFAPPVAYQKQQADEAERNRKRDETAARNARKAAQEARRASEAVQADQEIARLETDAPEAFAGFLRYVAREREQTEARYAMLPNSVRSRMLAEFDGAQKQRELFLAWKTLPETLTTDEPATVTPVSQAASDDDPQAIRTLLNAHFALIDEDEKTPRAP